MEFLAEGASVEGGKSRGMEKYNYLSTFSQEMFPY